MRGRGRVCLDHDHGLDAGHRNHRRGRQSGAPALARADGAGRPGDRLGARQPLGPAVEPGAAVAVAAVVVHRGRTDQLADVPPQVAFDRLLRHGADPGDCVRRHRGELADLPGNRTARGPDPGCRGRPTRPGGGRGGEPDDAFPPAHPGRTADRRAVQRRGGAGAVRGGTSRVDHRPRHLPPRTAGRLPGRHGPGHRGRLRAGLGDPLDRARVRECRGQRRCHHRPALCGLSRCGRNECVRGAGGGHRHPGVPAHRVTRRCGGAAGAQQLLGGRRTDPHRPGVRPDRRGVPERPARLRPGRLADGLAGDVRCRDAAGDPGGLPVRVDDLEQAQTRAGSAQECPRGAGHDVGGHARAAHPGAGGLTACHDRPPR